MTMMKNSKVTEPESSWIMNPPLCALIPVCPFNPDFWNFSRVHFQSCLNPMAKKNRNLCHVILCHDSLCDVLEQKKMKACWEVVLRPLVVPIHNCLLAQEPNSPLNGQRLRLLCMDASPSSQTSGPLGSYSPSLWPKEGCRTQVRDAERRCGAEGVSEGRVISFQPVCRHEAGMLGG